MDFSSFATSGMATVPYPYRLRSQLDLAAQSWHEFCALPEEVKKSVPYSNDSAGFGYEMKSGLGPNGDRKENFDVSHSAYLQVIKGAKTYSHPVITTFVMNAFSLVRHLRGEIRGFAGHLEEEFGLFGLVDEVSHEDAYFVRFIHYHGGRQPGDELASSHVDQSGLTFYLYKSAGGLQYLPYDKAAWQDARFEDDEMLVTSNMQMQLKSEGRIRALCHRVVATPFTATAGRFSAVCFVMLPSMPQYDKSRHGRLQEMAPGFNYDMPIPEFRGLFKT
jgi:isopenicillin N synthase-like dioxygenase